VESKRKSKILTPEECEELRRTESIYVQLEKRQQLLMKLLKEKESSCDNTSEGSIHVIANGKNRQNVQYYIRENKSDKSGVYLKKGNDGLIKAMIQNEYNKKLVKAIKKEIKCIDRLMTCFLEPPLTMVYQSFPDMKKSWINPVFSDDESFVEQWRNKTYEKMGFKAGSAVFYTKKNEQVRSKSEVIIANLLDSYQVPYLYEYPLSDRNGIWARPDFCVLNVRTRKEFFWEHFGMLDDPDYLAGALRKISIYEQHDYFQGKNLLISYESSTLPLNVKEVEGLIKKFLL